MFKALSTLTNKLPLFGKSFHYPLYGCYGSACFCSYLLLTESIIPDQKMDYLHRIGQSLIFLFLSLLCC